MESYEKFKKIDIKSRMCYHIDDIIKIGNFNFGHILTDEKSYKSILVYNISYKTLIDAKPLLISFDKLEGFIRVYDGTRFLVLLVLKNMILFTIGLDIL